MSRQSVHRFDHKVVLPAPRFNPMTMKYQKCFSFSDSAWENLSVRAHAANMSVADYVNREVLSGRALFRPPQSDWVQELIDCLQMPRKKTLEMVDDDVLF